MSCENFLQSAHEGAKASAPSIQTKSLEVTYPNGYKALHSTTLSISHGSFVVLLGTSGAGKSTLLRSFNGLVQPSTGSVLMAWETWPTQLSSSNTAAKPAWCFNNII
jgi:ABC-type phosphate/phosphonate transport system ATPase subunit